MGFAHRSILSIVLILAGSASGGFGADRGTFDDQLANLGSPNVKTRAKAARELGRSGRKEAIPHLNRAVADSEVRVREAVVVALREFKDVATVDGLLQGLEDEEKDVRREALAGLLDVYVQPESRGPLNRFLKLFTEGRDALAPDVEPFFAVDPRVIGGLAGRLQDLEPSIRRQAAFALGALRAADAVTALSASLADPDKKVRKEAVAALERIGDDAAGKALRLALTDSDRGVRERAIQAVGNIRYVPAVRDLLSTYDAEQGKPLGDRALEALSLIGPREARGVFFQNMTSSNDAHRRWAVEGLARMGDTSLVAGLTKDFLREPSEEVQLAYCFALVRLGRPEFVDRLALSLSASEHHERARRYLVELGSSLLSELVTYLSDPVAEVRKGMAVVLMQIGDPQAIPYLEPLLGDPDREVADRANRAIARLERARVAASNTSTR